MPTKPDDKQPNKDDQPAPEQSRFSGVRKYVENNDIAGLMQELDKTDTGTREAILNKISMSDGNGGRIELDGHQMVAMPDWMRAEVAKRLKKDRQSEQEDAT